MKKILIASLCFLGMVTSTFSQGKENDNDVINVEVKTVDSIPAMVMSGIAKGDSLGLVMGPCFTKIFDYMQMNYISQSGSAIAIINLPDASGRVAYEVAFPVSKAFSGTKGIAYKVFPTMKVLAAKHIGPYEKSGETQAAMYQYATANNIQLTGQSWQQFLTDTMIESDPAKFESIIYLVIKPSK